MKVLRNFSRLLVGLIFIFSGFVKVVDPLGSAYKFIDYFEAMHLNFLGGAALALAIIMSVAELVIGIALVFNLVPKLASWGVLLFMGFFTPLTLWLAIANPVSDCGCFGDALILTNWQTFYKNLIILAFVAIIFLARKKYKPAYNPFFQWTLGILFTISAVLVSVYCLRNLPIIDFRPYHIGASIPEGMSVPEDQLQNKDIYKSTFIYEKDGKQQEFTPENLPDSTWKFVDAKHILEKEGYKPPIHDFTIEPVFLPGISPEPIEPVYVNLYDAEFIYSKAKDTVTYFADNLPDNTWKFESIICEADINIELIDIVYLSPDGTEENFKLDKLPSSDYVFLDAIYPEQEDVTAVAYGEDIAPSVLEDDSYFFIMVMLDVNKTNKKYLEKINKIVEFCKEKDYKFYCLTASNTEDISAFVKENKLSFDFYNTDPITLKTVVRSNPGLLLLKNGVVLNKWAGRNIPSTEKLTRDLNATSITAHLDVQTNYLIIIYILSVLLFMSLFQILYNWLIKNKYVNN